MNDAARSEALKLLADSSYYREEGHHCGMEDLRQSTVDWNNPFKATFLLPSEDIIILMLIDAIERDEKERVFDILFLFYFFFLFSDCTPFSCWAESKHLLWFSLHFNKGDTYESTKSVKDLSSL